jgi:hypothetical protein
LFAAQKGHKDLFAKPLKHNIDYVIRIIFSLLCQKKPTTLLLEKSQSAIIFKELDLGVTAGCVMKSSLDAAVKLRCLAA